MCDRAFNVKVLVLSCAAFRGKNCTAVDLLEITVGELVVGLGLLVFFVVDAGLGLFQQRLTRSRARETLLFFYAFFLLL